MAISDSQKVDYLWKKLGYSASKTDTNANKKAPNEAISSPLQMRGDKVMKESSSIPSTQPSSSTGVVTTYPTSGPIECTEDITSTASRTWKTGQTDWISPEFGSTYQVKVYIHTSSDSAGASGGTQVFATGSGNDDEWFFDYQSGVLHFIGSNLPNGVSFTGKSVYIAGSRYSGEFGVGGDLGDFVFTNNEMAVGSGDAVIVDATTGLAIPVGTTAQRTSSPSQGEIRYNTTTTEVEFYNGASWGAIAGSGLGTFSSETFSGDDTTTAFTLQNSSTSDSILVVTNGVLGEPGVHYTVSGTTLTMSEAPKTGDEIVVRYIASATVVTGIYSPDTNNNLDVQNSNITLDIGGTDILTVASGAVDIATDLDMNSNQINNLADPTSAQDGATKAYVDGLLSSVITVTDGSNSTALGDGGTLTFSGTTNEVTVLESSGTITIGLPDSITANVTGDVTGDLTGDVTGTVSSLSNHDTDDLSEGSTNQYFTTARARSSISATGSVGYNSTTGVISFTQGDTDTVSEGSTNLYYTDTRVDSRLSSGSVATITTSGNVTVGGDLTVSGTTTTINTETINLADNTIVLNSNEAGSPTQDGGIEIERGTETNKTLLWDETNDYWTVGTETFTAGTFSGTATEAQYADLAEKYIADDDYAVGTVIAVGGEQEVTAATTDMGHSVIGVVSDNPAYLMNKDLENGTAIALKGRVTVRILGSVSKGDRLEASSIPGLATANNSKSAWSFAIALNDSDDDTVEAVIL